MNTRNGARLRGLNGRIFYDPVPVLLELRKVEKEVATGATPDRIKRLRTGGLKDAREARFAAIFALGVSGYLDSTVLVSPGEFEDGDFVLQVADKEREALILVQYKELPPADLNASADLDMLITNVQGRPSSDAVLAVHLNRETQFDLSDLARHRVPFKELWFVWCSSHHPERWSLFGDILGRPVLTEFDYPLGEAAAS